MLSLIAAGLVVSRHDDSHVPDENEPHFIILFEKYGSYILVLLSLGAQIKEIYIS